MSQLTPQSPKTVIESDIQAKFVPLGEIVSVRKE